MWEDLGADGVKALMDVSGEAVTTSGAMEELTQVKYSDIGSAFSAIGRSLKTEFLQPLVDKLIPAVSKFAETIQDKLPEIKDALLGALDTLNDWIPAIAAVGAAIATYFVVGKIQAFVAAIKSGALATKALSIAQAALNAVMSLNPIGLIIAAIVGLVAAFVILWNKCDAFREFWINLWEIIKSVTATVWEAITGFFSAAWDKIKEAWSAAGDWFSDIWDSIKSAFSSVKDTLGGFFSAAWDKIKAIWEPVGNYFKNVWDRIKQIFSVVKNVLSGNFSAAWDGIKKLWNTSTIGKVFNDIWNKIKNIFAPVGTFFKDTFKKAWDAVKDVFSNFGSFFSGLWDKIKNTFSSLGTSISDAIGGAVKSGINGVISGIENIINKAIGLINGAIGLINKIPGVNVGTIGSLDLPRLETGGVVRSATAAMIGENGKEAVVPLERNTEWMDILADKIAAKQQKQSVTVNQTNNYSQAHSRLEIYKSKQQTAAAVKLALLGV